MSKRLLFFVISSLAFFQGHTQDNAEINGSYITNGGWGKLNIATENDNKVTYNWVAMGGNGSSCEISGKLKFDQTKVAFVDGPEEKCEIDFKVINGSIQVTQKNSQECREFVCGARATFEGAYNKVLAECESSSMASAEAKFLDLYNDEDYKGAFQTAANLKSTCGQILNRQETGRINNDLALAQYRLNDVVGCRKTLKPYLKDAALSDDEILKKYSYDAAFAGIQVEIMQAVRSTLDLCGRRNN